MNNLSFKNLSFLDVDPTLDKIEWKGAVLFLANEEHVFIIKRSELMPSHAGQVAFFGGNRRVDEKLPVEVAMREFVEESGLSLNDIKLHGILPTVWTARGQIVIPVLAEWTKDTNSFFRDVKSNGEWDQCFAIPWKILLDECRWDYAERVVHQKTPILFFPFSSSECICSHPSEDGHLLWGATAKMIWDFLRLYFNTKS